MESVFNKIAGIDRTESIDSEINFIDLQLYRKKAYSKVDFAVGTSEFLALFLNVSSRFGKIAAAALQC